MRLITHNEKLIEIRHYHDLNHVFFISLFVLFFLCLPGFLSFWMLEGIGQLKIDCLRNESSHLTCKVSEHKFLGLIPTQRTTYERVTQAKLTSKTRVNYDRKTIEDHFVKVVTQNGEFNIYEQTTSDRSIDELLSFTDDINFQIQDETQHLESKLHFGFKIEIIPLLLFLSPFMTVGGLMLNWLCNLKLTKIERDKNTASIKNLTLLGLKQRTISLAEVRRFNLKYEDKYHILSFLLSDNTSHEIGRTQKQQQAQAIRSKLEDFIKLSQTRDIDINKLKDDST